MALDFALGAQFHFSSSFLKGITDTIRNALVIQRATSPREWLSPAAPELTYGVIRTPAPPSGLPPMRWPEPAPVPSPLAPAQSTREDTRHLKSQALMDPYFLRYNNVLNLLDILPFVQKANDGPPNPSTILPPYRSPVHLLEQCIDKMLPGPQVQVCQRPFKERGSDGRICRGSGGCHQEGGGILHQPHGRKWLPQRQTKGRGWGTEPLTSGGDGCSGMRTGGEAQDGCIGFRGSCS